MLVELRRRERVARRGRGERDRVPGHRNGPVPLPDLDHGLQLEALGHREPAVDRVDRAARHTGGDQQLEPLGSASGGQPLDEDRSQLGPVRGAVAVAGEPRVVGHCGDPEHVAQLAELPVVGRGDDQLAVRGRQWLVREHAGMRVAHAVGHHVAGHVGGTVVHQAREGRGQQVHLDLLALTGRVPVPQGREDPDHRVVAGHHVEHRDPGPIGRTVRITGQAHQARDRLHHEVVPGHRGARARAEPADRGVDDGRVAGAHRGVVETVLGQTARLEVLHQHVGAARELVGQGQVTGVAQVQRHRALPAVDPQVVRGHLAAGGRRPRPGLVALGRLDLHHVGPHVGEQHRRVGPGQHPGEVGDQDAGERAEPFVCHRDPPSAASRTTVRCEHATAVGRRPVRPRR